MTKLLDLKTKNKLINYLDSRFGIDRSTLENYLFIIKGNSVSIIVSDKKEIIQKIINSNFVKNIGIEIFSNYKDYVPSSLGFGIFKKQEIKNNFVVLDRTQTNNYFKNKEINVSEIKDKNLLSSGYVVCIYNNQIIGTARYLKEESKIMPNLSFVNEKIR